MQADDLETVQALQATELDGRVCMRVCALIRNRISKMACLCPGCVQKDDRLRKGFVKKVLSSSLKL